MNRRKNRREEGRRRRKRVRGVDEIDGEEESNAKKVMKKQ